MTEPHDAKPNRISRELSEPSLQRSRKRLLRRILYCATGLLLLAVVAASWLAFRVSTVQSELKAASALIPLLKQEIGASDTANASITVEKIRARTALSKEAAEDPTWTLARGLPWVGPNLAAVAEVARSADDVANLGLAPLVKVFDSLDWEALLPSSTGTDLRPLKSASPSVSSAAYAVASSAKRLDGISTENLLPEVAQPLENARMQLREASAALNTAADAARLAPDMLGVESPRTYLLMIQNNAEVRASGGIPGALAVLTLNNGALELSGQSSAQDVGIMSPVLAIDAQQQAIYSSRLGKFMQDVNLTPDFPTAASTAQAMWERKTGQRVDGVVSIDPVTLSYILDATGPVEISSSHLAAFAGGGLPTALNGGNVVQTLLSDVYRDIENTDLQDAYFASVAQEIFAALSGGKGDARQLIEGVSRGVDEGRVLIWSGVNDQQAVIAKYSISGAVEGASLSPAQFGLYFNDGTGAKMDYYVKRTVQLVKECPRNGYEETTIRVTSTNTAPSDASTALPAYVTGDGHFGVPPGSVQTNIVAYGPPQANVETAKIDGRPTGFAPHLHGNRPVGVLAVRLGPGESKTVEFTFGKIVQHTEPDLFVTPTVQPVKDVTLPTEDASCG